MNLSSLAWLLERANRGTGWLFPVLVGLMAFAFLYLPLSSEQFFQSTCRVIFPLITLGSAAILTGVWYRSRGRSSWFWRKERQRLSDSLARELAKMPAVTVIRSERTDPGGACRPRYR
jgi:hypothetical protein